MNGVFSLSLFPSVARVFFFLIHAISGTLLYEVSCAYTSVGTILCDVFVCEFSARFNARLTELLYELLVDDVHTMPNSWRRGFLSCLLRRTQFQGYVLG